MNESLAVRVVNTFNLTKDQKKSALERGRNVIVTAGAGSGKTLTLVGRYASLLADGFSPRQVTAITFTEKAAREMRSRLRDALVKLTLNAESGKERDFWISLSNQMDSARIGTIHSLCAEILRSHPADAGIDPRFDVLDEGLSATLKKQSVEAALAMMVSGPEYKPLFGALKTDEVKSLLQKLLDSRLAAQEIFASRVDSDAMIRGRIEAAMKSPAIGEPIQTLRMFTPDELNRIAGDKLAEMVTELLALWKQAESELEKDDYISCAGFLFQARREKMNKKVGSKGTAKEAIADLQAGYDELLDPLIAGKDSKDSPPNPGAEAIFKEILPLVREASGVVQKLYQSELNARYALDFDDLEYGAAQLLKRTDIRAHWQSEIKSLLVDEFQDTNARQREIVEAIAGNAGSLFVVGDARQSIYRFRRADVTVFRSVQEEAKKNGGLVLDLDVTYRAHEPLLNAMGDLLGYIMETVDDPARLYHVPFTPLEAYRKTPPKHILEPHIEIVFGAGKDADEARPDAARALAERLTELKKAGQIETWDEVALLFRATSGYPFYEDAFEDAGIPFVTVSGRGFYDRPEIRDILNLLRALADPADDLAMAGLLRSPAIGLSDQALYQLRQQTKNPLPYWTALQSDYSFLSKADQACASRAVIFLQTILPFVDREPVSELLKAVVNASDYRAILAADDERGSNGRLWRNLDKLISDARSSGQVHVRDFLEYISTLSDAGGREGEAPAEAGGAVRLMTIHKSKGLQFPVVVLADATRKQPSKGAPVYMLPEMGLSIKLDPEPMLYRLSKELDGLQEDSEAGRLLYVALTRAKEKLIISGHATSTKSGNYGTAGSMKNFCESLDLNVDHLVQKAGTFVEYRTISGHPVLAWCRPDQETQSKAPSQKDDAMPEESQDVALYQPIHETKTVIQGEDTEEVKHIWRATEAKLHVPPAVIGQMTHKAIELWLSVDDPRLIPLLETLALGAGLASEKQRIEAVRRARELIQRFCAHPLRAEIDAADERHHEVPYTHLNGEYTETGYIDLLYRKGDTWHIVDFKTDSIRSDAERIELIGKYKSQILRYQNAVQMLIGQPARMETCFLDDNDRVRVTEVA